MMMMMRRRMRRMRRVMVFELGYGFVGIDDDGFIRVYMHGVGGTGKCGESPSSNKSD